MDALETQNTRLVGEADTILYDIGLHEVLQRYGEVIVTGSYSLSTMTWRDLDVYIVNDELDKQMFFRLGQEIAGLLDPRRMVLRDEHISKTAGLPEGFYWGTYFNAGFVDEWKMDIWAMDTRQADTLMKQFHYIKKGLTPEKRRAALRIKDYYCKLPKYRKDVTSLDIYNAVIKDNIDSVESFKIWHKVTR